MSTSTTEPPRDLTAIEADIARTRASLNRKIQEIELRLSPSEQLARVKTSLDPRPHPEWIAVGAIVAGTLLAFAGWRRARRQPAVSDADLDEVVIFGPCGDEDPIA